MNTKHTESREVNLRPVVGLLQGIPEPVIERLTITAIKRHRELMNNADKLYRELPPEIKAGRMSAGLAQVDYLDAAIEMHSQMSALTTLLSVLGRTPKV